MHYSLDFRIRVIKFIESGSSKSEASRVFSVARSTILKLFKRRSESGSLAKRKPKIPCRKLDPVALASYVKAYPDFTLIEYAKHFGLSVRGIGVALKRLKITRKKRPPYIKKGVKQSVRYFWSR